MKFYDLLQLNTAALKNLIKNAKDISAKRRFTIAMVTKNLLCILFCFLFVSIFTYFFGSENSIAGVVILIAVMVFRVADLGINTRQAAVTLAGVFLILAIGPHLSNMANPWISFLINLACIFSIVFLACHNTIMSNQATFVLGYLLLLGNDVSGRIYQKRVFALLFGAVLVVSIFYIDHRKINYRRNFKNLFQEFNIRSIRTQWQLKFTIGIAAAMLIGSLLSLPRPMWLGIACMSVFQPFSQDVAFRVKRRAPFIIIGCTLFAVLYLLMPPQLIMIIGILGGFLASFCASYEWQTAFNCLGALSSAVGILGLFNSIFIRIINNILGTLYSFVFDRIFHKISSIILTMQNNYEEASETM